MLILPKMVDGLCGFKVVVPIKTARRTESACGVGIADDQLIYFVGKLESVHR